MKFRLPKIYPITDCRLSGLTHAAQIEKMIAGGATFIQLREKHLPPREFFEQARAALEIARRRDKEIKIIINDRVDIALALKADGVHLGQDDLPITAAREILGHAAIVGFSTHNPQQAAEAARLPLDYIAVGPVFPTVTKENPDAVIGVPTIRDLKNIIGDERPLVAIGGINFQNFREVLDAGADSAAVISDIVSDSDQIGEKIKSYLSVGR